MRARSRLAQSIPASGIKKMRELVRTLPDVIHLEVGEPDFPTPPAVVEAAFVATRAGATRYTPTNGTPELRTAIAARVSRRLSRTVSADEIVVTSSGTQGLSVALLTLLDEGDEILLPDPGWPNYTGITFATRAKAVTYVQRPEDGFAPTIAQMRGLISQRTKAILINNPSNPLGTVFAPELVEGIVRLAAERDLYVISDEIYEDFTFDAPHTPAAGFDTDGRVITLSGFSKTFAMTGWRLGYLVASRDLAAELTKVEGPIFSCPSAISQSAGLAALQLPAADIEKMRDSYHRRRDMVVRYLAPIGLLPAVPRGAFYAFVDLSRVDQDSNAVALKLLEEERVATTPGESFGSAGRGFVRLSYATAEPELEEGLRRIVSFVERNAPQREGSVTAAVGGEA